MVVSRETSEQVRLGLRDPWLVALGLIPLGLVFGVLMIQSGFAWWWTPIVYTLSGFAGNPARLWAALAALAVTLVLHWWKRRADLSILGGTALYMALVNLVL